MKIQIKTLADLEAEAKEPFEECTALISVSFGGEKWKDFEYKPRYILDVDLGRFVEADRPFSEVCIMPEQTEEIAEFVKENLNETDTLICQSFPDGNDAFAVAIAAAVEDFLTHDGGEQFMRNGCYEGYYEVFQMTQKALAGEKERFSAVFDVEDEDACNVNIEEIDTDNIV